MALSDTIKNLKAADRFKAFVLLALLGAGVSIATVWLKTDDCGDIAQQYETLVKSYSESMKINNQIIEDNNKKNGDILRLSGLLEQIAMTKPTTTTRLEVENSVESRPLARTTTKSVDNDTMAVVMMEAPMPTNRPVKLKRTTVVTALSPIQKSLLDSALKITKIYHK